MWLSLIAAFYGIVALVPTSVTARECRKRPGYSGTKTITCPGPYDPSDFTHCCDEFTSSVRCCEIPYYKLEPASSGSKRDVDGFGDDGEEDFPLLSDSKAEKRSIVRGLAKLVGLVLGVAAFVIILCVVCCCCCPFCFFYKRRNRGEVIRANTGTAQMNPQQGQQPFQVQQAGGYYQVPQAGQPPPPPPGHQPYSSQQGYPPQQPGNPPQHPGYPSQQPPYPPQLGYVDGAPPPYPGPPTDAMAQQGPAEPQKLAAEYQTQPAYNPSAP